MMKRTSAGVARMRMDMIMALMDTDLPEPVVPPMSKCGIFARSDMIERPSTSLPTAIMSGPSGASLITSPRSTLCRTRLGTSIPT